MPDGEPPPWIRHAAPKKDKEYHLTSPTGKPLFSITAGNEKGKKRLAEILLKRAKETEETSLKFSNLSREELALWKEGRPSHQLRYELSFWSDLAKWWMLMQEAGDSQDTCKVAS